MDNPHALQPVPAFNGQLSEFETAILDFIGSHGLPAIGVLVGREERNSVLQNVSGVLARVRPEQLSRSIYLSKFIAAVASGLFDAALNYLWDETISELRGRVSQYDLSYFFDNAVSSPAKRSRLRTADDLDRIDDSELIEGAHRIGLISTLGLHHLEYIRYMRNWASAAHPHQIRITGLQLASWLETSMLEVINLPPSRIVVEIGQFLASIRNDTITEAEARQASIFTHLSPDQANSLATGFFGIYTANGATPATRKNIHLLLPALWERLDEGARQQFGVRYGRFVANGDQEQKELARAFLDIVGGGSYMPNDLRVTELDAAVEALLTAHRNYNNRNTEPLFARELRRLVGAEGRVPPQISDRYVRALVEVYLTNGTEVVVDAEPIYLELIDRFDAGQARQVVLAFTDQRIGTRLRFDPVEARFRKLLLMMSHKTTAPAVQELISAILRFPGPLQALDDDPAIRALINVLATQAAGRPARAGAG